MVNRKNIVRDVLIVLALAAIYFTLLATAGRDNAIFAHTFGVAAIITIIARVSVVRNDIQEMSPTKEDE